MEVETRAVVDWVCAAICTPACFADGVSPAVDLALGLGVNASMK